MPPVHETPQEHEQGRTARYKIRIAVRGELSADRCQSDIAPQKIVSVRSEGSWNLLPGRPRRRDRLPLLCGRDECHRKPAARQDRLRLRLPEQHGRLRYQPDADPVQRSRRNLWRCLHRRPAQHPARLGDRHLLHDDPRLRHRHRAPVQELDGGEGGDGLCRGAAQHSAAGAAAVLVHRRSRHAAAAAQLARDGRRLLPEFPRPLHGEAPLGRPISRSSSPFS